MFKEGLVSNKNTGVHQEVKKKHLILGTSSPVQAMVTSNLEKIFSYLIAQSISYLGAQSFESRI